MAPRGHHAWRIVAAVERPVVPLVLGPPCGQPGGDGGRRRDRRPTGTPLAVLALPLAAPLLSLFLLVAAPALESYRGLSGLVGVLVVGAVLTGGGPAGCSASPT